MKTYLEGWTQGDGWSKAIREDREAQKIWADLSIEERKLVIPLLEALLGTFVRPELRI